jgi:hypothetical protein
VTNEEMQKAIEFIVSHMVEGFKQTNAKIDTLIDAQMRTEANIGNLTAVVASYFSEGRNGQS